MLKMKLLKNREKRGGKGKKKDNKILKHKKVEKG
jgi:hypothetical protein